MRTFLVQIVWLLLVFILFLYHKILCVVFALLTYPPKALSRKESLRYRWRPWSSSSLSSELVNLKLQSEYTTSYRTLSLVCTFSGARDERRRKICLVEYIHALKRLPSSDHYGVFHIRSEHQFHIYKRRVSKILKLEWKRKCVFLMVVTVS